jgi:GT2 family glycosyltransferase
VVAALFDLGDQAQELARAPYGANMAFRKTMFQKYGGFRTDLGPRPGTEMRNEDTEFGRRLLAGGERLRYEPTAVVYHPVFVERLRQDYFLDWYIAFGRAAVREWGLEGTRLGLPRRFLTLLRLLAAVLPRRILIWLVDYDPRRRFHHKCWVWMTWGHIREVWQDLRGPAAGHRSHGTTGGQGDPGAASGSIQLTATPGLADKPNPPS